MRKSTRGKFVAGFVLAAATLTGAGLAAAEGNPNNDGLKAGALNRYNVVWDSPSANANGSMPLGNGDVGLNLWVEPDGDLLVYLSKTDAWSGLGRLLKLGRLRVSLDPNPFRAGQPFRQTLRLREGEIEIVAGPEAQAVTLRVWVDALRPVVHVEAEGAAPLSMQVKLEVWRSEPHELGGAMEKHSACGMMDSPEPLVEEADTILPARDNRIAWFHRNQTSCYPVTMQVQALGDLLERFPDPLLHRTFGGCIAGPGLVAAGNQTLRSAQPGKRQQAAVYVLTAQTATPAAWEERLDKLVQTAGAVELDRAREEHRRWWEGFWNRSWIFVDCDMPLTLPESGPPWRVGVDSNGGNRFRGQIVQPRVIGRALSADEIAQLAAAPRGEETALQEEKMAGGCTTAAWIKPAAGEIGRILEKGGILFDTHSGKATDAAHPGLALRWIVGDRTMTHPICLKPGEWQHVAATADAGGVRRIYLNGKPVMEERIPGGGETPTRGYVLQRFINACGGRGAFPIKFNGSIFTVDGVDGGQHCNADYRRWGGCYWFQNTRLAYWPMLYAGDFDLMQPLFRMYREALPLARERTRKYYKHGGAFFPETMYFWGTYANDNYGWKRQGKPDGQIDNFYIRNYWDGALELTTMMLEYHAQTGDERYGRETLLPLAQEVLAFYEQHYPQRDAQGKIVFSPANSLETYASVKNPLPVVAGLRYVTQRILSDLPEAWAGELRAQCQRLRPLLPDLPAKTEDGQTRLLPFDGFEGKKGNNTENPELYAVFPYRLYGLGLPELAIGRATFDKRMVKGTGGWYQDAIQAALLGVTDTAAAYTYQNFSTKHKESRFPAFWGPNSDWIPDQDHGGVSMIALQRMLMQCDGDRILLLPAWPREWNVDFQLCAPRQTTVRAVWRDGKLATLEVTPAARRADVVLPETR